MNSKSLITGFVDRKKNKHIGSSVQQFKKEMKRQEMTKSELAERMQTSRSSINRLLDPSQPSNLKTLIGAARSIGKHLQLCIT